MSTKGMSTTARLLLDRLAPQIEKVLVLHDFDVSGFSIFGTQRAENRRYEFENDLPIVDIGLRQADVEAMGLQSEPVETQGSWASRSATLAEHGATPGEIDFLQTQRVELNAMTAPVFIHFLERKLIEHGVRKIVPDGNILEHHARRLIEQRLADRLVRDNRPAFQAASASAVLPADLAEKVWSMLEEKPMSSWDAALAAVITDDAA